MRLATRGENKTRRNLHHTLAALTRYFPASLVAPLPNSEQINPSSSNLTYTKLTPNHIHHHFPPSVTSTHTTNIISSTAPTYAPHYHPWICGQTPLEPRNCWPHGRKRWLVDHKWEDRTTPLARVKRVGRQQQACTTASFGIFQGSATLKGKECFLMYSLGLSLKIFKLCPLVSLACVNLKRPSVTSLSYFPVS